MAKKKSKKKPLWLLHYFHDKIKKHIRRRGGVPKV